MSIPASACAVCTQCARSARTWLRKASLWAVAWRHSWTRNAHKRVQWAKDVPPPPPCRQMYEPLKRFLDTGTTPETWTSGVVTMIPKTKAMQTPESLRPIALQTTRQKWLTNILLIQLEDVLLHCVPAQQTGLETNRRCGRVVGAS